MSQSQRVLHAVKPLLPVSCSIQAPGAVSHVRPAAVNLSARHTLDAAALAGVQPFADSMPFFVMLVDARHRILLVNAAMVRTMGKPATELIGAYCPKAIHCVDAPIHGCPLEEALVKGSAVERDLQDPATGRWVSSGTLQTPYCTADGESVFLHMVRDITDQKQAALALLESEANLRQAQTTAKLGSWTHDLTDQTSWSDEMYRVCGVSPATFVPNAESFVDLIHPDDRDAMREWMGACAAGKRPNELEFRTIWPDGTVHSVSGRGELHHDADGRPIHMSGTAQDITERKQSEIALANVDALHRTLFDSSHHAVMLLDEKSFFDCNATTVRMFGCRDKAEFCTKHPADCSPTLQPCGTESMTLASQHIATAIAEGEDHFEWIHKRLDTNETFPADVLLNRMFLDDRPVLQATVRDLTKSKRQELEGASLKEQLQVAQKMEAVGRLAGGVAHDFNNLLAVILSYADFAGQSLREGDPLRGDIEEIRKAGQRAASLTRQLLAFSRKQVLDPKVLELNRVAADLEKMLRRLIGEDIDLLQVLAPDLGLVKADSGQIEQVIMNLVVNARDAMPSGGKLTIETANVELDEEYAARHVGVKPGSYVLLAVSDTGCGMDAATRQRLFEPFFTTKEKGKGTGLGLSTVYGIVKQSGGNVCVYSEPGKGTTFKTYLPRVLEEQAPMVTTRTQERPAVGTETILVVEDEEAVRNLTARILRAAGFKVLVASHGGQALLECEKFPGEIHLLLTDVVMPQMSGPELAARLDKVRPGLRVLYMSGYTDDAIVHHGVLAPGTKFIGKPFNAVDLALKVRDVLDEHSSETPSVG